MCLLFPYSTQAGSRVDAAPNLSTDKQNRDGKSRSGAVEGDYIRLKRVGNLAGRRLSVIELGRFGNWKDEANKIDDVCHSIKG